MGIVVDLDEWRDLPRLERRSSRELNLLLPFIPQPLLSILKQLLELLIRKISVCHSGGGLDVD